MDVLMALLFGFAAPALWFLWCVDRRAVDEFAEKERQWEEDQSALRSKELKPGEWKPEEWTTTGKPTRV
jgi:hypothetical protein